MDEMLKTIADKYGVSDTAQRRVGKPELSRAERKFVRKLMKQRKDVIKQIAATRHELLSAASGGDVRELGGRLVAEGHELLALSLVLNDEQIAVIMALADAEG